MERPTAMDRWERPPRIQAAKPAVTQAGGLLTQSEASPTYRVTTRVGSEVNGVRLFFCESGAQQGLARIELQGMDRAWTGAGEATERVSLQVTRNASTSPEVCGLCITCTGGTAPAQLHGTQQPDPDHRP